MKYFVVLVVSTIALVFIHDVWYLGRSQRETGLAQISAMKKNGIETDNHVRKSYYYLDKMIIPTITSKL